MKGQLTGSPKPPRRCHNGTLANRTCPPWYPRLRMTRAKAALRIDQLRAEIRRHDHLYYVLARPTIADEAYDALLRELGALEEAHPDLVTPDSPTQRVAGTPAAELAKVEHVAPMLSLDATREE